MVASSGNGNGFKMGGNNEKHDATLRNCLSVYNRVKGFDQNNNNGSMILYNCTGYKNGPNFGMSNNNPSSGEVMVLTNCVSYSNRTGSNSFASAATQTTNSWQSPFVVDATDFTSLDTSVLRGPRNADGSLPDISLLHLASGSDLINSGTNVGLGFYGAAPDLGAFETNYTLPVGLLSFSGLVKNNTVVLNWKTASEFQNAGWEVEKWVAGTVAWQKIGFVAGKGNSNVLNQYAFTDAVLSSNTTQYRLKQMDVNGRYTYSNVILIKATEPKNKLSIYPNPSVNVTNISFNVSTQEKVQVQLYNCSGQLLQTVVNELLVPGVHQQLLATNMLSRGEYMLKLTMGNETYTQTLVKQ